MNAAESMSLSRQWRVRELLMAISKVVSTVAVTGLRGGQRQDRAECTRRRAIMVNWRQVLWQVGSLSPAATAAT